MLEALALVLVIEGLLPLFFPKHWRQMFAQLLSLNDGQLRFVGLLSLAIGTTLFLLVKN